MAELCSVCDKPADPKKYVGTGGGCDYPVCSDNHGAAVWLFLDAAETAANQDLPNPPCPITRWPDWCDYQGPATGTIQDLQEWVKKNPIKEA